MGCNNRRRGILGDNMKTVLIKDGYYVTVEDEIILVKDGRYTYPSSGKLSSGENLWLTLQEGDDELRPATENEKFLDMV